MYEEYSIYLVYLILVNEDKVLERKFNLICDVRRKTWSPNAEEENTLFTVKNISILEPWKKMGGYKLGDNYSTRPIVFVEQIGMTGRILSSDIPCDKQLLNNSDGYSLQ